MQDGINIYEQEACTDEYSPPTLSFVSDAKRRLTINEVIAFNLGRARRRKGWTQEETAAKLTEVGGKKWTKMSLSLAERSWETDRVREFNGDELATFCWVFRQPVSYFLLPPDGGAKGTEYLAGPDGVAIEQLDWLQAILPMESSHEFVDLARASTRPYNLEWQPGRWTWYRIDDYTVEELEDEAERRSQPADEMPSTAEMSEEARRRRVAELADEIRRLMLPEEYPPF